MKKISLVLALFFSVIISTAQTWTNVNGRWGYEWLRAPKTLFIPSGNGAPSGTASLNGAGYKGQAAIYSDTTSKKLYMFNPKDSTWTDITAVAGVVDPTMGGTGLTTVTTGDLLYGSATNTWAKLPGVATGNALISGGVGTAFSWGKIGLTTHVSGILPIANGGSGTATPGLVAGTNTTITGTWPNQTINSTGGGGGGGGLNVYNNDSTLATNRTITQSGRYLRLQNGIPYTEILGGKTTILPDSGIIPYYIREIKSPFSGSAASGMISWYEGIGSASQSPERPNYPYMRGWNLAAGGGAFIAGLPAMGESWEPHYLPDPGSPNLWLMEQHKFFIQKSGVQRRIESWTINTRDNDWNVYYTTPQWSLRDTNAVDYVSASRSGGLTVNNTTAGTTNFSIVNGSDNALFSLSPGTSILDFNGAGFQMSGELNTYVHNGSSTGRAGIRFKGDGGTVGYLIKYGSAWAAQSYLQNAMLFGAANGNPTETSVTLKPDGTAWIGNIDAYNTGTKKVNISGTLALYGIGTTTTAPEVLVRTTDSSGKGMTMANLATVIGAGRTIDAIMTTAQNTGTSETDLYSKTIDANTLTADKQTINYEIDGEVNDNTATAQLKLHFGGNVTLNTGSVVVSTANTAWKLTGYIMRTSSTTAHVTYELECPGLATDKFLGYSNLTGLDFTTTNVLKITAQAGGAGGGTADVTAHSWQLLYKPAP